MPEISHDVLIRAPIDKVWDFAKDMKNWAPMIMPTLKDLISKFRLTVEGPPSFDGCYATARLLPEASGHLSCSSSSHAGPGACFLVKIKNLNWVPVTGEWVKAK